MDEKLTKLKMEQLSKQPILEDHVTISEDGKWLIAKATTTIIKPMSYLDKIKENRLEGKKEE